MWILQTKASPRGKKETPVKILMGFAVLALAGCTAAPPAQEADLSTAVAHYAEQASPDYAHAFVDLDKDGVDDAVVWLQGMDWCGSGGCTMLVLRGGDDGYAVVSRSTVTREPIRVSDAMSHGWHDLIVHSDGVEKLMQFDGKAYPSNPSMQPTAEPGQVDSAKILIGK